MASFDPNLAQSATGQSMTIDLNNGIKLSFVVKVRPGADGLRPISASALPTYSDSVLGNGYYRNTPGKPALYSRMGGDYGVVTQVSISGIAATRNGVPISSNYSLVMADAEITEPGEGFVWESSDPLKLLTRAIPSGWDPTCELVGIGSKRVTCVADSEAHGDTPGAVLVYADSPTSISTTYVLSSGQSREAIAFAVLLSSVEGEVSVESRHSTVDSFSVSASSGASALGQQTTGKSDTATTGSQPVLTDYNGSAVTFRVDMDAGSPSTWADYNVAWSCHNSARPQEKVEYTKSSDGRSVTVDARASDEIKCGTVVTSRVLSLSLEQSVSPVVATATGQNMDYRFDVTNTGEETVTNLSIEPGEFTGGGAISEAECPTSPLLPGATVQCTANYAVTPKDVSLKTIWNTATAQGIPVQMSDPFVRSNESTAKFDVIVPGLSMVKNYAVVDDANDNGINDPGDVIKWTFDVTNTGNLTLHDVAIVDELLDGLGLATSCEQTTLAAGASTKCGSENYTITQADVLAGGIHNVATATGVVPAGTPGDPANPTSQPAEVTVEVDATPVPGISLVKNYVVVSDTNSNGINDPGDVIKWTFSVTNSGNTGLNDVSVSDPLLKDLGVRVTCTVTSLAAGESTVCESADYTITDADMRAGGIQNVATASGVVPTGTPGSPANPTSATSEVRTPIEETPAPGLALVKDFVVNDVNGNGINDPGDVIKWTFAVTNSGNTTLENIVIVDELLDGLGVTTNCDPAPLAAGALVTCESDEYTITDSDVQLGEIHNVATATGVVPAGVPGNPANPASEPAEVTALLEETPTPSLTLEKNYAVVSDANNNGINDPGDVIKWTFAVTNTGNTTLNEITISDDLLDGLGIETHCDPAPLAAGATVTCESAEYTITGADVQAGGIHNVATASGQVPADTPGAPANPVSGKSQVTVSLEPLHAELQLKKSAQLNDTNGNGKADLGETIDYSFLLINSGTAKLTEVFVKDPLLEKFGITVACPSAELDPGATMICTSTKGYVVTAKDIANGKVLNRATGHATPPAFLDPITPAVGEATVQTVPADTLVASKGLAVTGVETPILLTVTSLSLALLGCGAVFARRRAA